MFMSLLILSGYLVHYPYLFRTGVPFYYLAAPLLYIYVRSKRLGESRLRRLDWIHFVPAILAFVDLFPYFFLTSLEFKKAEMAEYSTNHASVVLMGRGILPPSFHYYVWTTLGMGYALYQWWLLFIRSSDQEKKIYVDDGTKVISVLFGLMYAGNSLISYAMLRHAGWFDINHIGSYYDYTVLFLIASVVALSVYVFSNPTVLYGKIALPSVSALEYSSVPDLQDRELIAEPAQEIKAGPSPEFLSDFIPRLENFMETSGAYRRKGITVYDIAKDLGIAPNVLSNILNTHYNQRFNDYINSYRIQYVTKRLKSDSDWRKLSIEGLAEDAGFSSRTPFYAAFKRYTGLTPSLFMKQEGL